MYRPVIGITAWRQTQHVWQTDIELFIADTAYVERIKAAGGLPLMIPHIDPDIAAKVMDRLDGLVVIGGDDVDPSSYGAKDEGHTLKSVPEADLMEVGLVRAAAELGLPILGICRGHQILNIAFGGTLEQHMLSDDEADVHGKRPEALSEILAVRHPVRIDTDSILANTLKSETRTINSTHHQAVKQVAPGFRAIAWAPDGTIEAIQSNIHPDVLGVQWHPEKLPMPDNQEIFEWLVARAAMRSEVLPKAKTWAR